MLKSQGKTIWDALIAIYQRHGLALSMQKSLTKKGLQGQAEIANIMKTFRENPPSTIAGATVLHLRDYQAQITQHFTTDTHGNRQVSQTAITLPKSNVLAFDLADKSRVIVRPSGTEPKIKFYFEARTNIANSTEFSEKSAVVQARLQELWNAMSI
jgi:phosphoglucomutase